MHLPEENKVEVQRDTSFIRYKSYINKEIE